MTTKKRKSLGARAAATLMSALLVVPLVASSAGAAAIPAPAYDGPLTWTNYTEPATPGSILDEVHLPLALDFDDDDNLYITKISNRSVSGGSSGGPAGTGGRIEMISDGGLSVTDITYNADISYAFGITADQGGNLYVTDNSKNSGQSGNVATIWKRASGSQTWNDITNGETLNYAMGVAADDQGNVYVVDSETTRGSSTQTRILKRAHDSLTWTDITPSTGIPTTSFVYDIVVDGAGNLYVSVISRTNPSAGGGQILKLPPGGTTWTDLTPVTATNFSPYGMGIDEYDNLFVVVWATGSVLKLPEGGVPGDWKQLIATPAQPGSIFDVAADSSGYVYSTNPLVGRNVSTLMAAVLYDGNGASGTVPSDSTGYRPDETATVAGAGTMTKAGHTFSGWATAPNSDEVVYEPGDTIPMTRSATLYAVWTPVGAVTLSSLQLDSSAYTLSIGGTHQSVVTAVYSDHSTAPLTSGVTFSSGNTSVATVDNAGLVTAVGNGQSVITATYGSRHAEATVTVQSYNPPPVIIYPNPDPDIEIIVDGVKQEQLATAQKSQVDGRNVTTILLNNAKIIDKLEREGNKLITIPVTGDNEVVVGELNGSLIKKMEDKDAVLQIQTDTAAYTLPASLVNIDAIAAQLGANVKLEDIKIQIRISETTGANKDKAQAAANASGAQLIGQPIDFEITVSYGLRTIDASKFNGYVERTIVVPNGVDPNKITTGTVLTQDGELFHVPTVVSQKDGKYYATIKSLTNSTYAVVYHPREMADVKGHWAEEDVNDMSSRLVIEGLDGTRFAPNATITRAEFAAIVTRGLGIQEAKYAGGFADVAGSDWFAGAVQAAIDYKLVTGYENGTFLPNALISRQEAAVVLARASAIAKLKTNLSAEEISLALSAFADGNDVAGWAREEVAAAARLYLMQGRDGKLDFGAYLTRAETAALVRRLLQTAYLIDR
ncbi:S-layer homology domain-containing protein [Cohnella sp. GCM10027633]|uniref:S-layer homology domain-containing protein n=1 Tax=unclassified Cohnella TaxID=2636738 RepID=UPI0036426DE1